MDLVRFAEPFWFVFLGFAALPWIAWRRRPRLTWPTLEGFAATKRIGGLAGLTFLPPLLQSLAIACLVVGLARPQAAGEQIRISGRGVAIALVVDRSSSMKTADFPAPTGRAPLSRLDAAKQTLRNFLEARGDDLIGVVAFANLPATVAPPTLDRRFTWAAIGQIRPAGAADDGTDLGGAIAWGLDLVRPIPTRRKVVVLLTDGRHAPGSTRTLDPVVAAEVARGLGVTLHTVAIGRPAPPDPGPAPAPTPRLLVGPPAPARDVAQTPPAAAPVSPALPPGDGPDLALLGTLAERGNGRAFVAADADALDAIFEAIDALETVPIQGTIRTVYRERFVPFVGAALGLVAIHLALGSGRLRRLP